MRLTMMLIIAGLIACLGLSRAGTGAAEPEAKKPAGEDSASTQPTGLLPEGPTDKDYPHLHHLIQVSGRVYSGGEPESEEAFAELVRLGVRTIVSVDGARPKVELAEKHGLRYVHIPIGYDGVSRQEDRSLASVARNITGPLYVHCHHGKHRGPAAAAVVCIADGAADGRSAIAILEKAGISKGYGGLWRDVQAFLPPADGDVLPELVSVAEVGSLAAAMAQIDRASDNLKLCDTVLWHSPPDHPDISPTQEALLLKEGFRETVRQLEQANDYDDQFLAWMREAEQRATQLESALKAGDTAAAKGSFTAVQEQCTKCHKDYRK